MHRHDVAVYAGDIGDARPPIDRRVGGPLHRVALPRLGMPLIDVADLTGLAAACAEEGRATFLFVAAPPAELHQLCYARSPRPPGGWNRSHAEASIATAATGTPAQIPYPEAGATKERRKR
jgi:hypothetical protein